jgi:hypothetical protein
VAPFLIFLEAHLAAEGVTDFSCYAVVPDLPLLPDLFL